MRAGDRPANSADTPKQKSPAEAGLFAFLSGCEADHAQWAMTASISNATMFVILIIGLTAGPAVSL